MNCLNCNATLAGEAKFCDALCNYGFKQTAYKKLQEENNQLKKKLRKYEDIVNEEMFERYGINE